MSGSEEFVSLAVGGDPHWFAKLFVFYMSTLVGVPLGILLCRIDKRFIHFFFCLMLLSICEMDRTGISFMTREHYKAATRGLEISLTDLIAVILFVSILLRPKEFPIRGLIPLSIPYFLYLTIAFASWAFSESSLPIPAPYRTSKGTYYPPELFEFELWLYPSFQILKVLKGFFICWVTANLVRNDKFLRTFVYSIAIVIVYITILSLHERYIGGRHRVRISISHPNDLATFIAAAGAVIFPFIFAAKQLSKSLIAWVLVICVCIVEVLTISRGGLLAFAFVMLMSSIFIFRRYLCMRNVLLVALAVLMGLVISFRAKDTLFQRFTEEVSVEGSVNERTDMSKQAVLMANEHFLGVGLGNFSAWAWHGYAERANPELEPGLPIHNIWALNLSELGWLGLFAFVCIWVRYYSLSLMTWFGKNSELAGLLLVGCTTGTVAIHIQSLVHFSYRQQAVFALMQVMMGVCMGIVCLKREQEKKERLHRQALAYQMG
ncbi:MAG: hypothetical protein CMO81_10165 [Waddliaceae bacterium]|nr:hypothetical protein [Waddliaceae bacterium]